MSWLFLVLAGIFEMVSVTMINRFHEQRTWTSLLLLIAGFGASFFFLSLAMETLPMGTAYAVWTGIGAAGGVILNMALYGESRDWRRVLFLSMILFGAVGLKLFS